MSKSVPGILREGRIELLEPLDHPEGTHVVVILAEDSGTIPLEGRMDQAQAADLRARLRTFWEDWDRPEMDVYDRY